MFFPPVISLGKKQSILETDLLCPISECSSIPLLGKCLRDVSLFRAALYLWPGRAARA